MKKMDSIRSIQKAIDYMEENLLEKISYEDAARHIYMSNYHFHRLFSMLSGMTANEYIRCRRLSMAGHELALSGKKVINVALKYGYESPESFAKAFLRFHGVSPNAAKRSGAKLKSFNRLVIKIRLEGGTTMDYKIIEKEPFKLLAKVEAFNTDITSQAGNTEIPDFWTACINDGSLKTLEAHTANHDLYGACGPSSKESPTFNYGIAMKYEGGEVPEGFVLWDVAPTLWAVFKCMGPDNVCIGETWERIFNEFLPGSDYDMLDDVDLELYPEKAEPGCFCEVWIPIKRKS